MAFLPYYPSCSPLHRHSLGLSRNRPHECPLKHRAIHVAQSVRRRGRLRDNLEERLRKRLPELLIESCHITVLNNQKKGYAANNQSLSIDCSRLCPSDRFIVLKINTQLLQIFPRF